MFKKIAIAAAASALVLASTAHAGASALSLSNAGRASTAAKKDSDIAPVGFALLGLLGVVAVLEVTGAINIVGDDSDSN